MNLSCNLLEVIKTEKQVREYILACLKKPQQETFFGVDLDEVLEIFSVNHEALTILPARYGLSNQPHIAHHVSMLAIVDLYLKRNPKEKRVPKIILETVIGNQFKPNRSKVYNALKESATYKRIKDKGNSDLFAYERLMDFAGCRRYLFARVVNNQLQPKDSLEYVVLERFLRDQGVLSKGETLFDQFKVIEDNGYTMRVGENKVVHFPNELHAYSEIFCFGKVSRILDTNDLYVEFATNCYSELVKHINETKLDFLAEMRVMDVLHAIMTVGGTSTPIVALPDFIKDEEKKRSITEVIAAFFMGGLPVESWNNELFLDIYLKHLGESSEHTSAGKLTQIIARNSDISDKLEPINHLIKEFKQTSMLHMVEADYLPMYEIGTYTHKIHASRGLIPFTHLHSRNYVSSYMNYLVDRESQTYDLIGYAHFLEQASLRAIRSVTIFFDSHAKFEILLSILRLGIACGLFDTDKTNIIKYVKQFEGLLSEVITEVFSCENVFSDEVQCNLELVHHFLTVLEENFAHLQGLDEVEDEAPDDIFRAMEKIRKSDNFDAEKFTELSLRYAQAMSGVSEVNAKRKEVFYNLIESLKSFEPEIVEEVVTEPEQQEPTLDLTEEFKAVQGDLDEAMELLHSAETERDTLKSELNSVKSQLEETIKRAYSLERPAVCGEALIKYAKKGYIDSVAHALAVAEGLSEGKLRVLPSAWESAENSRYNLPEKVKQSLCLLADRYLEDLKIGGVAEAKKGHGRSFKSKESKTVMQSDKFRDQRTFVVDGEKRVFETHLSFGNKAAKDNHIRIYFDADMENNQVIIGYCGRHLDTINTN